MQNIINLKEKAVKIVLENIYKKWVLGGLGLLLVVLYFLFGGSGANTKTEEYIVKKDTLNEAVSLTGRVEPTQEANITFEKGGTVRSVSVKIGDVVRQGQVLATLSDDAAYARVREANASLNSTLALLEEMQNGGRPEQIEIKKLALENTKAQIENQYKIIEDTMKGLAGSTNDAVRVKFSNSFDGGSIEGYRVRGTSCDSFTEYRVNTERKNADIAIDDIQKISNNFYLSADKNTEMNKVKNNLEIINNFLNEMNKLFRAECILTSSAYDITRSNISSSLASISTAKLDFNSKVNTLNTLKVSQRQAEEDLRLTENGERSEKIKSQQAAVEGARARLQQANAEAAKNTLEAPFSGIITVVNIKAGEYSNVGGANSIGIISNNAFQIESKVSEIDVAKLFKNQKTEITFDAYGDGEKFEAIVSNVSPAGIITDGVPTYKTIFTFVSKNEKIKSGMTANIKVITKTIENVLSVPIKFTKTKDSNKIVSVKNSEGKIEEKIIVVGAKGLNGEVEVKEGLDEGDVVILEK